MDFLLSESQTMLADSVERYLRKEYDFAERARILGGTGYDPRKWRDFADFGWLAAALPEEVGGLGGTPVDTLTIMHGFGRHLVLEPFVSTVVMGARLLLDGAGPRGHALVEQIATGDLHIAVAANETQTAPVRIATRAVRQGAEYRLSGYKPVVPNAAIADKIVVPARTAGNDGDALGITLFLVDRDRSGVTIRKCRGHDGHNIGIVTLENVALSAEEMLGEIDHGLPLLECAIDYGTAALCAEAIGSAEALLETTSEYLKTREQYDVPLASFQVLQHRLAEMYVAIELGRSMAMVAAQMLDAPEETRVAAIAAAKAQIAEATMFVGKQAVQLHGGVGVAEEHRVIHHLKRLQAIAILYGDSAFQLERYVAASTSAPV